MINYVILVSDEAKEFQNLIKNLKYSGVSLQDIIVVRDTCKTSEEVSDIIQSYNLLSYSNPLNMDFARQRNFANSKCWQPYIFHIDADEAVSYLLLQRLPEILKQNPQIDILGVPRLNYLDNDIDLDPIPDWVSPPADEFSRIAWPDFQYRIIKNSPTVKWINPIHEVPTGGQIGHLNPVPSNCIVHTKTVSGQMRRQKLYEQINKGVHI